MFVLAFPFAISSRSPEFAMLCPQKSSGRNSLKEFVVGGACRDALVSVRKTAEAERPHPDLRRGCQGTPRGKLVPGEH